MDKIKLKAYYDSVQGGRSYMEDVINVRMCNAAGSYAFFCVFDGHGGTEAAEFADKHLRHEIDKQEQFWCDDEGRVIEAIKNGFVSTHKLMSTAVGLFCLNVSSDLRLSRPNEVI